MIRLDRLHPSETDVALAYAELVQMHEPRSAQIGHTTLHACTVCDEVWPCHTATLLAGFRDFRQDAKALAETTMALTDIASAAAEVISGIKIERLSKADAAELLDRLTVSIEQMQHRKGSHEQK